GEVVFWKKGAWVEQFADAQLFSDDAEALEAEGHGKAQVTEVVDVYLIDLVEAAGVWAPLSYRERIKALGPTNHPMHGKQAEGGRVIEALAHVHTAARSTGRVDLIKRK